MSGVQIYTEKNRKEKKQHGNYEFPVHVSSESIQSYEQNSFMWHWHPEIELTWFMSGQMEYDVNDRHYIVSEGQGLFCNSNALHAGYMIDGQDCNYLSITFHPRFIYGYENSILQTKYVDFITSNDFWSSLVLKPEITWQKDIIDNIKEIYQLTVQTASSDGTLNTEYKNTPEQYLPSDFSDYEFRVHLLLCNIWHRLYLYFVKIAQDSPRPQKHLQRLKDILSYIQEHASEDISLEDISTHAGLCKSECCRFFKKYMRMTIFDYLLSVRIQNSIPYLMNGENITAIAGLVGFSSPAYYGQIFKRYMGMSPSQYKKNAGEILFHKSHNNSG